MKLRISTRKKILYFKLDIRIGYQMLEQWMNWAFLQLLATLSLLTPDMVTGFMKSSLLLQMEGSPLLFLTLPTCECPMETPPLTGSGMEFGQEQEF